MAACEIDTRSQVSVIVEKESQTNSAALPLPKANKSRNRQINLLAEPYRSVSRIRYTFTSPITLIRDSLSRCTYGISVRSQQRQSHPSDELGQSREIFEEFNSFETPKYFVKVRIKDHGNVKRIVSEFIILFLGNSTKVSRTRRE